MFLPKRPRQPTLLERATGIRADIQTLVAQAADPATAADLRAVAGRVDHLIADLAHEPNGFRHRMVATMRRITGARCGATMGHDLEALRGQLHAHLADLARDLLGEPSDSDRHELRWGRNGSLALVISGEKAGRWHDHEAQEGGDVFKLIQRARSCD